MKQSALLRATLLWVSVIVAGYAHTASALTISPAKIDITGDPGTTVHGEIKILNEQSDTRTFFASYENFEPAGDTGAPHFIGAEGGLATWLKTESKITLAPGEIKVVPFSITIPTSTEAGGYFGAIFWGSQSPDVRGTGEVAVGGKIGALVLLSVSGEVNETAGLVDFGAKDGKKFFTTTPVAFTYRMNNTGGDRIVPLGTVRIKNSLWLTSAALPANKNEGSVLPGSMRKFETVWGDSSTETPGNFWGHVVAEFKDFHIGLYVATLSLGWGTQGQTTSDYYVFFVLPWHLLLIVIPLFVGLVFFGRKALRAYNQKIISQALQQKK